MTHYLLVFLGGGLGAAVRHGVNVVALRAGTTFPYGTLCINVVGSLLMGVVVAWFAARSGLSPSLRLFLATGVLGGFTTFSAFSLEAALLYERGQTALAVAYVLASVVLSIGGLFAGMALVRAVL
ncbi:fluoride efflux transporter CrcB [Luteimonas sp. S4-F44]|uniref:fluoride efflux transporter CrcB n=1 Tax=Luteimonas sp. S4-F44 TaxID=2925842 RepID=UPI001F534730|nr:fluoride efflux transporter CrcB [Luteimonas sp. S4-F44]UNK41596.1 fluoride efflux transporter CrcB [Luteimonas sp. S4-F44]